MRTPRGSRILAGSALVALLAGGVAAAGVTGTVTDVSQQEITVGGVRYRIDRDTALEDQNGRSIAVSEIRPGTPVEIELDGKGGVGVIRATVVR